MLSQTQLVGPPPETVFEGLLDALGLRGSHGLATDQRQLRTFRERQLFEHAREKLGADGVFFGRSPTGDQAVPLIYFRCFKSYDPAELADAHRLAWSTGQCPLLFAVVPGRVLVYNAYRPPAVKRDTLDPEAGLAETLDVFAKTEAERQKVLAYHRIELETGRFWQTHRDRFDPRNRADQTLLKNLDFMRKILVKAGLDIPVVHSLLGRSIFIRYLEDRRDTQGNCAFPAEFFASYISDAVTFADVLASKEATYRLFEYLERRFNGDIFPVVRDAGHSKCDERDVVEQEHLDLLARFLRGDRELGSRQLRLWPLYSFDVIPVQTISSIYEQFFHVELEEARAKKSGKSKKASGTHYTPHHLVEFLMDEVLPWEGVDHDVAILDPACGSGIFLVEAYRRLIARWMQAHPERERPLAADLKQLLTKNIFGVDSNEEALRVAGFSLYLAMCDYLEPRHIWQQVKFPPLRGHNLHASDFFVEGAPFAKRSYDLIVGNPPWESSLSDDAQKYAATSPVNIPDKQIALAFLLKAPDLCAPRGQLCLVEPSKGLLFNRSKPHREFRRYFLDNFRVRTVVNFSALRRALFEKAVGPAAAIIYGPKPPTGDDRVLYCCPKPDHSARDAWHFMIEPYDVAEIPQAELAEEDVLWKVAMWGGPRDWEVVRKLRRFRDLASFCQPRGEWVDGEGYKIGNRKSRAPELARMRHVATSDLTPLVVEEQSLPPLGATRFERYAKTKLDIFLGPHLLVSQSPRVSSGLVAALLAEDAVFSQSIIGIHGNPEDISLLAACCVALNTDLPLYVAMLTSSRWLVERDELTKEEVMSLPLPVKPGEEWSHRLSELGFDDLRMLASSSAQREEASAVVREFYELTTADLQHISDALTYTLDYFRHGPRSNAARPLESEGMLMDYAVTLANTLTESLGCKDTRFGASVFVPSGPLNLVSVALEDGKRPRKPTLARAGGRLTEALAQADRVLTEKRSQGVHVRRNVRVYDGNTVYVVKSNQRRYWTQSTAMRDADEIYEDIMQTWSGTT